MPLHDWTDRDNFDGFHTYWMTEIARQLRTKLPPGYRAVIGTSPTVSLGGDLRHPDVAVTNGTPHPAPPASTSVRAPDAEVAVTMTLLDEDLSVQVERNGRLVAVVELISPRNKDRPSARDVYTTRYLGYLQGGVHLLIVDVHRRPVGFSFPQRLATELQTAMPGPPAPSAVSYRVGGPTPDGGRFLAVWAESLTIGQPLPVVVLPISDRVDVTVDLDASYSRAAEDSYLE
ncbi:MAG: DUF4058 family protein [Gemmataceae bacterium]